jgi:hypothetical protein
MNLGCNTPNIPLALQPNEIQGLLILYVSRSHTTTQHSQ